MSTANASLSSASQDRKARLAQLRSLKRKQPDENNHEIAPSDNQANDVSVAAEGDTDVKMKYLSGRNFDLDTGGAKLGFEHAPDESKDTVEKKAGALAETILEEAKESAKKDEPLDLFKLQPKKPNWDLKRDLKQRMETLDIRTENAIARIVRERIANQQKAVEGESTGTALDGADLVEAVHVREREELESQQREKEWEAGLADSDI